MNLTKQSGFSSQSLALDDWERISGKSAIKQLAGELQRQAESPYDQERWSLTGHAIIIDTKNVLSINSFSSIQSENVTQKQHHRTFKLVSPETRHQQYQRILSKKYVKALQFPPITRDDKLIALKNASTYLKRLKLINAQKNRSKFKK